MLVLRVPNRQIFTIGDEIKMYVLKIYDDSVKIGIDAPKDIKIMRKGQIPEPKKISEQPEDNSNRKWW